MSNWETYGPAVIAAGAALAVVIVDRIFAAKRDRREALRVSRTLLYVEMLTNAEQLVLDVRHHGPLTIPPAEVKERYSDLRRAIATVRLVAEGSIIEAADDYIDALADWADHGMTDERQAVMEAARDRLQELAREDVRHDR